jgi:hypothetical protein
VRSDSSLSRELGVLEPAGRVFIYINMEKIGSGNLQLGNSKLIHIFALQLVFLLLLSIIP